MPEFKGTQREWQQMVYGMPDVFYDKYAPMWAGNMRKELRGRKARALRRFLKHPERHITTDPLYCCGCVFKNYHKEVDKLNSQLSGWCYYLNTGDFMPNGTTLLWDGCKECGVNDSWEELKNYQAPEINPYDKFILNSKGGSKRVKAKRIQNFIEEARKKKGKNNGD